MNAPSASNSVSRLETAFVLLLSLAAAAHVFIFSAAFPFFNNVDEPTHFDLVVRYSHGDIPRSLTPPDDEALRYITVYGTMEYVNTPESQPGHLIAPPAWKQPFASVRDRLQAREAGYRNAFKNYEASQPPLYYTLAGGWWRLGKALGFDGEKLLYWLRFLNLPLIILLVWLAWLAARLIFPENAFIRVAVPALIAFMPQTAFYSINNDILAPITFGLLFILVLIFLDSDHLSPGLAVGLGLAFAAAYLTKTSNLPLLAAAGLFIVGKIVLSRKKSALGPLLILLLASGLPILAWMLWCKINFGDLTGSALKIQFLGWTDKPFAQWWTHPLFTLAGFKTFAARNLATFWLGEFTWHAQDLMNDLTCRYYSIATAILLAFSFLALCWRPPVFSGRQQTALVFSVLAVAAMFAFFVLLSIKFDFHDCFNPSREHPYFTSGRLMLGMLIPFLLLFTVGLDRFLSKTTLRFKILVLFFILGSMLTTEILQDWVIFPNDYNWFHP